MCVPVMGERIEESVAGDVVRLARRTDYRGNRRKHQKEIQWLILSRQVKVPGAKHFWGKHIHKALAVELHDQPIFDNGRCMSHTAERNAMGANKGHCGMYIFKARNIAPYQRYSDAQTP